MNCGFQRDVDWYVFVWVFKGYILAKLYTNYSSTFEKIGILCFHLMVSTLISKLSKKKRKKKWPYYGNGINTNFFDRNYKVNDKFKHS